MANSQIDYQPLQDTLENERVDLAKELKSEMLLNAVSPSMEELNKLDLYDLLALAKAAYIPNLYKLATRLEVVDAAVCSIRFGLYGLCADCEEEIDLADLEADPAQPRCRHCREHSRYHHDA
ncbi:TPA: conjugal transfer protein TraR [Photobacterium damselae]|uniref:Conjugal transfer protein TraR n=3 Tax=Photobacterium damselae TaxID=38293 RepID=A0A1Q9H795_PHODP|nr:TraR/DksA C4-type zinc finger protein [Photobacterium damselae]EJN6958227.1 conjugal transfer protein TraR [Photobacterium damselae]KAB1509971.1 conjugal transfer protein TraR [Photobacterium damselae subsp. damselae]MBE8129723.1 conjugal transfer protein TraR [Photobacterium damselae subsp. piscicida]MCG3843952.1 conjugal transfer protein TraR [Photobacterium damselae]MCG9776769.1 TraR/DksA C4-type zinc finger protein [Photobacterium damselae]